MVTAPFPRKISLLENTSSYRCEDPEHSRTDWYNQAQVFFPTATNESRWIASDIGWKPSASPYLIPEHETAASRVCLQNNLRTDNNLPHHPSLSPPAFHSIPVHYIESRLLRSLHWIQVQEPDGNKHFGR